MRTRRPFRRVGPGTWCGGSSPPTWGPWWRSWRAPSTTTPCPDGCFAATAGAGVGCARSSPSSCATPISSAARCARPRTWPARPCGRRRAGPGPGWRGPGAPRARRALSHRPGARRPEAARLLAAVDAARPGTRTGIWPPSAPTPTASAPAWGRPCCARARRRRRRGAPRLSGVVEGEQPRLLRPPRFRGHRRDPHPEGRSHLVADVEARRAHPPPDGATRRQPLGIPTARSDPSVRAVGRRARARTPGGRRSGRSRSVAQGVDHGPGPGRGHAPGALGQDDVAGRAGRRCPPAGSGGGGGAGRRWREGWPGRSPRR